MLNVFVKKSAEELYIQLSNGRMMLLEDLVMDYERLLNEDASKKVTTSEPKDDNSTVSKLKVGKWFRIDRDVIDKSKEEIRRKCDEAGDVGARYWKRFEVSNKIADDNPDQYPRLIETYIFDHSWMKFITQQEMRDMCEKKGEGMCDEIICDLELQMRICNGESTTVLFKKADKLPRLRIIKLRNGGTGWFGGGAGGYDNNPPAALNGGNFYPYRKLCKCTPYAFRRVLS